MIILHCEFGSNTEQQSNNYYTGVGRFRILGGGEGGGGQGLEYLGGQGEP